MRKVKNAAVYMVLILASLISVFPLYWMIAAATNNSTDILGGKLTIGANLASNLTNLLARQQIGRAFSNSMFYSVILSVLSLLICSIAGYAFEIYHDKAKDVLMSILLLAMMVPFAATLIPLFKMFTGLHLQRTWIAYADAVHTVFDHDVPTERTLFPDRDHRGGKNRRTWRTSDFL